MKRRKFVKQASVLPLVGSTFLTQKAACSDQVTAAENHEIYELRRYNMRWGGGYIRRLNDYLEKALIPALNRNGVPHVGVFTELSKTEPAPVYVLIPYPSWEGYMSIPPKVVSDSAYQSASADYNDRTPGKNIYNRYDIWLMRAFDGLKQMIIPDTSQSRIFELRTYEGSTDDAVDRKERMFSTGEIELFKKTKLHPVFFGRVLSGPAMPALTYMLHFKDMAERDANWDVFINHPEWKVMSSKPEFANTVSTIIRVFLEPAPFSQV